MGRLVEIEDGHLLDTLQKFPPDVFFNDSRRSFFLAIAVIKYFFGDQWLDRHIAPGESKRSGFLRVIEGRGPETQISSFRIVDLAELLFNLQKIEGFDRCIEQMKHGDLEGTYAELDLGRMLHIAGHTFRFIKPKQMKREDYDVEIILPDGTILCADAKCKIETTDFSKETVINALDKARKQLPDRPGIIFVKVPSHWIEEQDAGQELNDIALDFLRGTGRIVSVKYYISRLIYRKGTLIHDHAFREISNPNNRFDNDRDWDILIEPAPRGSWNGMPTHWRRLLFFPNDGPSQ